VIDVDDWLSYDSATVIRASLAGDKCVLSPGSAIDVGGRLGIERL
jgi:hypothetical protein